MKRDEFMHHWPSMVRVASTIVSCPEDAEECAAQALEQVLCLDSPIVNLEAFLITVTKRRAVDLVRSHQRSRAREEHFYASSTRTIADSAEDVVARAEARWVEQTARRLLSPRVVEVLTLVGEELTTAQVAQRLHMTERAVESHLLRARKTMRRAMAQALTIFTGLGAGLRRLLTDTIGATPTTVAALMLLLPALGVAMPSRPVEAPHFARSPASMGGADAGRLAERTDSLVGTRTVAPGAGRKATADLSESTTRVAVVHAPMHGDAFVDKHDSGGNEQGVVEVLEACIKDFQLNPDQIGCSGN